MNYETFISYRRADKEVAEQVFKTLTEMRHRVFFDTESLTAGNFADHIRKAIRESEMVVSILTCDSIRRMAENPETDMVRLELQACRGEGKLVRFFWLRGGDDPQSALYEMLEQYKDDEFFQWLLKQNITPFRGNAAGVQETCRLVLKAVEQGSQRLALKVGDKEYVYYGETRVTWKGVVFPYGQGTLVENSGEDAFLVYEGEWETLFDPSEPPMYIGTGTVYRQKRSGGRVKVYKGHWTDLLYDDQNGTLYEDDGETVKRQGCFLLVKDYPKALRSLYKPDGEVPRIVVYAEGGDTPLFRGEAIHAAGEFKILAYGRGEERAPDGCVFTGHFNARREPQHGELRIPCGDSFHVYRGQVEETTSMLTEFSRSSLGGFQPSRYGRMEYADGSSYEGFWDHGKWSELGVAVIHAPEFDIRIEGSFGHGSNAPAYGGYPDGDTREVKISLRRKGETDFRLIYYAPESPDRSAVPYRFSGVGTFYYADGSRYNGNWDGKEGKAIDWEKNITGRFLASDGTEFHPDDAQLRRYEREERAIFDPLWSWAPDKPIPKAKPGEPVLQKLTDGLLIPTQSSLSGTATTDEDCVKSASAQLAPDGGEVVLTKRIQKAEKKANAAKKPADRGSALPEDAFDFIQTVLNCLPYPYSREKVLLFLNTADNDVCLEWRALPEDEAQQKLFLQVHAVNIGTDMAQAGA